MHKSNGYHDRKLWYPNEVPWSKGKDTGLSSRRYWVQVPWELLWPLRLMVRTSASQAGNAGFKSRRGHQFACLVELVYTSGLRSDAVRIGGSSPSAGTKCACDGTGIRVRLKPWCPSWACEFKSHLAHQIPDWCNGSTPGFDPGGRGSKPRCGAKTDMQDDVSRR